eukprot:ANDGO_04990.mRNA.1 hypothetical protein
MQPRSPPSSHCPRSHSRVRTYAYEHIDGCPQSKSERMLWRRPHVSFLIVLCLCLLTAYANAAATGPLKTLMCANAQFFNAMTMQCEVCPTGQVTSADGASCTCARPMIIAFNADRATIASCQSCPTNQVADAMQQTCITCPSGTSNTTGGCVCAVNQFTVSSGTIGACEACQSNQKPSSSGFGCVDCPDPVRMTYDTVNQLNCQCPSGFVDANGACVSTNTTSDPSLGGYLSLGTAGFVSYKTIGVTFSSGLLQYYYVSAFQRCAFSNNQTACHELVNLCVLQLYDQSTRPCQAYLAVYSRASSTAVNGVNGWPNNVPWLFFATGYDPSSDKSYSQKFALSASGTKVTQLPFWLAVYDINGLFLGWNQLGGELLLCPGNPLAQIQYLRFGFDTTIDCNFVLETVLRWASSRFFELYLLDSDNVMRAVPVDAGTGTYVRRFFVYDNLSGQAPIGSVPQYVRVAKKFSLAVNLRTDSLSQIYMPVLKVTYVESAMLSPSAPTVPYANITTKSPTSSSPSTSFVTTYTMDYSEFLTRILIAFIFIGIFMLIAWAFRMFVFVRCRMSSNLDGEWFLRAIISLVSTAGDFLFLFVVGVSIYFWVVFKYQSDISLLIPPNSVTTMFYTIIVVCLVGKTLNLVMQMLIQSRIDVFFVDWEKTRGRFVAKQPGQRGKMAPVSIWRTLFVANEWNELQTIRKTSLELTLFLLVLVLIGFDVISWATPVPSGSDITTTTTNPLLRFAVTTLFWFVFVIGQLLLNWLIIHRFISNPLTDFVDLVSLANISVFILRESHHGYYIHGRSVHPNSDATMLELRHNMQKEEDNVVAQRGMMPDSDCQTFEMFITADTRQELNDMLWFRIAEFIMQRDNPASVRGGTAAKMSRLPTVNLVKQYVSMNRCLKSFIDRIQTSPDHVRLRSFWHRAFGIPPDVSAFQKDIFFYDDPDCFSSILLFGMEWNLVFFNLLLFCVVDWSIQNIVLSAIITWLVDKVYIFLRGWLGERNLSEKTLIDGRFLL